MAGMKRHFLFFTACFLLSVPAWSQRVTVKIIDRRTGETNYNYQVPGHSTSTTSAAANCYAGSSNVNCTGNATTNGTYTAPRNVSYSAVGATFTLLLPDGRLAVVNCASKYSPRGDYINRRSCRMPIIDDIEVEFSKDNAKLFWPVSLDGKKLESETYKILGILPK
jgi:hypothetical protein